MLVPVKGYSPILLHSATTHCSVCLLPVQVYLVAQDKGLFVSAFRSFWPPKADADCQTLTFSASFYKIRLDKNHSKST
jgi:hypothetical protein